MGPKGINAFLRSHKCNAVCKLLKLPENTLFVKENVAQLEASSVNTSLVTVVKTQHLAIRQGEREISDREIQLAKKHGKQYRQPSGNIKHEWGDVRYVTSKDFKVGVTAFTNDAPPAAPPMKAATAAAPSRVFFSSSSWRSSAVSHTSTVRSTEQRCSTSTPARAARSAL